MGEYIAHTDQHTVFGVGQVKFLQMKIDLRGIIRDEQKAGISDIYPGNRNVRGW